MSAFDVCINPQIVNEITMGNYPRKVDEYLAMGKPVVATRTGTMELFRDHVYLCSSPVEYLDAIDKALTDRDAEKVAARINFAHSHSWKKNVERIYTSINEVINK
jgi:glycosyltransferase involved in cell wall biosynthesis